MKEKTAGARPSVGAERRAMEPGTNHHESPVFTFDSTTPAAEKQSFRIADFLHPGAENAISRRELMSMTGFSDRELRLKIGAERRQGVPILSDCVGGYFLPGAKSERDRCVKSLRRRAGEIMETAAAIEQAEV